MFFTTRTFCRLLYDCLFNRKEGAPPDLHQSILFCLFFLVTFAVFELVTAVCLLLDEAVYWRYRRVVLHEPIFIIGNPRSGTTILHRVMACDKDRFFFFTTWEIFFPSIVQKTLLSALGRLDAQVGSPLRRAVERFEERHFETLNRFHEFGIFKPEEDDKLLLHILASPDLAFVFPYGRPDLMAKFDIVFRPSDQHNAMEFYARCLRRQAYMKGAGRTLLSKSPWSSARVESLQRQFPNCKFIYLVRNPLEVVASIISFSRAIIRETFAVEGGTDLEERVYDTIKFFYTYPLERLSTLPPERYLIVNYEELLRHPKEVFERIYERFGLPLTTEARGRLDIEVEKMRQHRSRHKHSLDRCSVTRERIVADLRPIFDRFAFDTQGASAAQPVVARTSDDTFAV